MNASTAGPLGCPPELVNHSEDVIQRLSECHIHNTFQEDIFLLLHLRTAPRNPEFIKSMHRAACKAPSSLGSAVGGGGRGGVGSLPDQHALQFIPEILSLQAEAELG